MCVRVNTSPIFREKKDSCTAGLKLITTEYFLENHTMETSCKIVKEINVLKEKYKKQIKVNLIKDVESNVCRVLVKLTERLSLEFFYSTLDTNKNPDVTLKGFDLSEDLIQQFNSSVKENYMIEFIEQILQHKKIQLNNNEHKDKNDVSKTKLSGKKPSMKTAEDVINRIIWDADLETTDFTLGYLDRFLGVIEKNFTAFNWEDIASVGYDVLAIPKHRIQYFKYKNRTVWDKTKRIDDIFGSTGSGLTINDIIQDCFDDTADNYLANTCPHTDISILTGIELELPKQNTTGPTHFLCQRISNANAIENISEVQKKMLLVYPVFQENIILPNNLHCTLCTVSLNSNEDMVNICKILEDNKEELKDLSSGLKIEIESMNQFFNRVVYASVVPNESLNKLVDYLKYVMQEGGIQLSDLYEFIPHVTLLKLNHDSKKKIPSKIFEPFLNTKFGYQHLNEINLCEISKNRSVDGFYKTIANISLN